MKSFIHLTLWPATVGTLLIIAATGCGRDNVKVYQVDASDTATPTPPLAASGTMPTTMPDGFPAPDNSGLPSLKYTLPAGWETKTPSQMRVASFAISKGGKQADASVVPMGGMAGGNLANVTRWRGQVGLDPIEEDAVQKMTEKVVIAGQDADLFDIPGTNPGNGEVQRIIASVLNRDGTAWFFKITGDSGLVEAQKPAFIAFLKSVSFGAPVAAPAQAPMDMSQLPPLHPPIGGMNSSAPAGDKPTWTVPADWQPAPLAQFLIAKYVIAGADGASAAVNVSSLTGDGGGLLANVNRWRDQLNLAHVTEGDLANLTAIDASGGKASVIEFSGTLAGKPAQLVGVVLPLDGQTWFYKLMGDANVVAQQKAALVAFVQSAKYPHAH